MRVVCPTIRNSRRESVRFLTSLSVISELPAAFTDLTWRAKAAIFVPRPGVHGLISLGKYGLGGVRPGLGQ